MFKGYFHCGDWRQRRGTYVSFTLHKKKLISRLQTFVQTYFTSFQWQWVVRLFLCYFSKLTGSFRRSRRLQAISIFSCACTADLFGMFCVIHCTRRTRTDGPFSRWLCKEPDKVIDYVCQWRFLEIYLVFTVDKRNTFQLTLLINLYSVLGITPARSKIYKKQNYKMCIHMSTYSHLLLTLIGLWNNCCVIVLHCHVSGI